MASFNYTILSYFHFWMSFRRWFMTWKHTNHDLWRQITWIMSSSQFLVKINHKNRHNYWIGQVTWIMEEFPRILHRLIPLISWWHIPRQSKARQSGSKQVHITDGLSHRPNCRTFGKSIATVLSYRISILDGVVLIFKKKIDKKLTLVVSAA